MSRKWGAVWFGLVSLLFIIAVIATASPSVPGEFRAARERGAVIAAFINNFSEKSISSLREIEEMDKTGRYSEALSVIDSELTRLKTAREKSLDLLIELQQMALKIDEVGSYEAQKLGVQAVSANIAMVSRLIAYNDHLNDLFLTLRLKYISVNPGVYDRDAAAAVKRVNDDALAINELSRRYQSVMKKFDEKTAQKWNATGFIAGLIK